MNNKILLLIIAIPLIASVSALFENTELYYDFSSSKEMIRGIYNLTANEGSVSYNTSNCKIGSCGQFSANNNVFIPRNNFTTINDSYSINFWVRPTNANQIDETDFLSNTESKRIATQNTTSWLWGAFMSPSNDFTGRTPVANNSYFMITITRDPSIFGGNVSVYVNGQIEKSGVTGTANHTGFSEWGLGYNFVNNNSDLNGQIDELGWWNVSLSQSEINSLYNSGSGIAYGGNPSTTVVLNLPVNGSIVSTSNYTFEASIYPKSTSDLDNATIFIWNSTGSLVNSTIQIVSGNDTVSYSQAIYNLADSNARYYWNVQACETNSSGAGICTMQSSNNTFQRSLLSEVAQYYAPEVYETTNNTFSINISVDPSATLFSASLVYNGTRYLADDFTNGGSGFFYASKKIDVPTVLANTNKSFYWEITLDVGDGFNIINSSSYNQSVLKTNILNTGSAVSINYTLLDEETLKPINATFSETFNWFLGGGTQIQNTSYSLTKTNNFNFYTTPSNYTFYTNSFIVISNASFNPPNIINGSYADRIYQFNLQNINGTQTNQEIYLMNSNNGTTYTIQVRSSGLVTAPNIYVQIKRFYPGENKYRIVESRITDSLGQFDSRLIAGNVRYRFLFYDLNNTLLKETGDVFPTICSVGVNCIIPFVLQDDTATLSRYNSIPNFFANFSFNNNTNTFSFVWNDNSGDNPTLRLLVERTLFNGTSIICNSTSSDTVGRITCNVGSQKATYRAQIFRKVGTKEIRVDVINNKVGDLSSTFGLEGLMWSFVLLFTMVIVGAYYPPIGVILYLVGFLGLGAFDVVYINPAIAIAQLVLGIFFIWAWRG